MYNFEDDESYYGGNIPKHKRRHEMSNNYQYVNSNSSKYHMYEYPDFSDFPPTNGFNILQNRYIGNGRNEHLNGRPNTNYFSQEFYRNDHGRRMHRNDRLPKERYEYKSRRYETPTSKKHGNMPPKNHRFIQRRLSDTTYDRRDMRRYDNIFENYEQPIPKQRQPIFPKTGNYPTEEIQPFEEYEAIRKVHYDFNTNDKVDYNDNNIGKTNLTQKQDRNKSKLCIIVFKIIFLLGGIATGLASCIKAPWWAKTGIYMPV